MKHVNLFTKINERYGRYIWQAANRYQAYTLTSGDIFDEILLLIHKEIIKKHTPIENEKRIKSLIISRSIDLLRAELRHFKKVDSKERGSYDEAYDYRTHRRVFTPPELLRDEEFREHLLFNIQNDTDLLIICEIIWPSKKTTDLATRDACIARAESDGTTQIRMNRSGERIMKKHVAESLGMSPARVTKALNRIKPQILTILEG